MGLVMRAAIRDGHEPRGQTVMPPAATRMALGLVAALLCLPAGCAPNPRMLPANQQVPIDRSLMTYPKDFSVGAVFLK